MKALVANDHGQPPSNLEVTDVPGPTPGPGRLLVRIGAAALNPQRDRVRDGPGDRGGVELLQRSEFELDLPSLFNNGNHGSVIRSWLVELMRDALKENPDFDQLSTYVEDTQEVKWVLAWALERDIPTPVISDSQQALMEFRDLDWPSAKAVALLRHGYGRHPVHRLGDPGQPT